jgi:small subunit ribosomal protein S9
MKEKVASYLTAVGRRKTAIARVRLYVNKREGFNAMTINNKNLNEYFQEQQDINVAQAALNCVNIDPQKVSVKISGGGIHSQAVSLATARAAIKMDEKNRPLLRAQGLLTRDPRAKERKKPGLKRARRAPQWSKR